MKSRTILAIALLTAAPAVKREAEEERGVDPAHFAKSVMAITDTG